jgi:hypothetical protein
MLDYGISLKFMLTGYAVFISVLLLYLGSLFLRWRNLNRDFQMLLEIQKKEEK